MYSKAAVKGHSIHPFLVGFPAVFYTTAFIGFTVFNFVDANLFWYRLGVFCTYAGIVGALAAAVPGMIDFFYGIPKGVAAKRRGLIHMSLNVGALLLFAILAYNVYGTWNADLVPVNATPLVVLSLLGVLLTATAGFHGWALVSIHKVGVSMTPEQERLEPVEKMDRKDHEVSRPSTTPQFRGV